MTKTPDLDSSLAAELVRDALQQGVQPFATIVSNSMAPLLRRGDQVQIGPAKDDDIKIGAILILSNPTGLVAHRYWKTAEHEGQLTLVTRGDRLADFDSPSPISCLIGQVVTRRRNGQLLSLSSGPGGWLNQQLTYISTLDARLLGLETNISGQEAWKSQDCSGSNAGKTSLSVRIIRRLLYFSATLLTETINLVGRRDTLT